VVYKYLKRFESKVFERIFENSHLEKGKYFPTYRDFLIKEKSDTFWSGLPEFLRKTNSEFKLILAPERQGQSAPNEFVFLR